jgi:ABC-type branched-subunit amino acid transport system substrate-binding protein
MRCGLTLAWLLSLGACAHTAPPQVAQPASTAEPALEREPAAASTAPAAILGARLAEEARASLAQGDRIGHRRLLHRLLREAPGAPQATAAGLDLAEEALGRRAWQEAARWASGAGPIASEQFRRHRVLAVAYEAQDQHPEAAKAWLLAQASAPGPAARSETTLGAARAQFLAGDPTAAVETVAPLAPGDPAGELQRAVAPALTRERLERLYDLLPGTNPWSAWVSLKLARSLAGEGNLAKGREATERAYAEATDPLLRGEARELLDQLTRWDTVKPRTVGVLLPLSGPYQALGTAALEAIQLAAQAARSVTLVVRDTAGQAEQAAELAEKLILEQHVVALFGPIGEVECAASLAVSVRYGVPHLPLGSAHDLTQAKPGSFRFRMSREEEGYALARYAVTQLGLKRVAIVYPEKETGRRLMAAFWDEVVRLGGEVHAVEGYDTSGEAGQRDFTEVVKRLIGGSRPGTGKVDFEALFIADSALSVRRFVPFLKTWSVPVRTLPSLRGNPRQPIVQLLGAAGWQDPAVIDRGDNLTDNAVFVSPWAHRPTEPLNDAFARSFADRYRKEATAFHAETFDAFRWLSGAAGAEPGVTQAARLRVRDALLASGHLEGATGVASIHPSGAVLRQPVVLTIDLDAIRPRLSEPEEEQLREKRMKGLR